MRHSSRIAPPVAVVAALLLAGCGGGGRSASYTVSGHPPPASGPAITVNGAQEAIEARGADVFQVRSPEGMGDLDPRPVDGRHFTTADSGFFDLYVFADPVAARAALGSVRDLNTADLAGSQVLQVSNVVVVVPGNGVRSQTAAIGPGLRALAQQQRRRAASAS